MSTERRPAPRPTTRVPGPVSAPAKAPTGRVPTASPPQAARPATGKVPMAPPRPATGRIPTASAPIAKSKGTSRSVRGGGEHHATTRSVPSQKKGNPMVLWGGVGGGALLLIIIIAVAASGGPKRPVEAPAKKAAPKPVDVAGLERDGEAKCEEGLGLIQRSEGLMSGRALNASEKTQLKNDLDRGIALIKEGMSRFDEANQRSGNTYSTTKYTNAMKAARMKVGELK